MHLSPTSKLGYLSFNTQKYSMMLYFRQLSTHFMKISSNGYFDSCFTSKNRFCNIIILLDDSAYMFSSIRNDIFQF